MNIFINDNPITKEQVKGYLNQLRDVFPLYFDQKNPKPVLIQYRDDLRYIVRRRRDGKGAGHLTTAKPLPQKVKCLKFARNEFGTSDMFVMTKGVKQIHKKTGEPTYPSADIFHTLGDGTVLHPGQNDIELIYWYFFSGKFTNGKIENPNGEFVFVNPVMEGKKRIEDNKETFELQKSILYSGHSNKEVERYLDAFGLEVSSFEEVNRTTLYDFITSNEGAKTQYYSMVKNDENSVDVAEAIGLVRECSDRGKIVKEGDKWCFVNKTGVGKPFAPVDELDPLMSLAKLVAADETLKRRFEKAVEEAMV